MCCSFSSLTGTVLSCPNAIDPDEIETQWLDHFAPNITQRFNKEAPGANVTNADILNFMQLCGFATEYTGNLSLWCGLFKPAEWSDFEVCCSHERNSTSLTSRAPSITTTWTSGRGTATVMPWVPYKGMYPLPQVQGRPLTNLLVSVGSAT